MQVTLAEGAREVPAIECKGLTKAFLSVQVLRDLDLTIPAGVTLAITGPSGSGKSTLLSIIGLLARPSAGRIELFGQLAPVGSELIKFRQQSVSWIFQRAALLSNRSVLENITLPLLLQGADRSSALGQAAVIADAVGLGHRTRARARTLSGGEQQRVEIARALVRATRLILCDEPTANLDRTNAELVADLLVTHKSHNSTIVIATHDLRVAERCDEVVRLQDGQIVAE